VLVVGLHDHHACDWVVVVDTVSTGLCWYY